MNKIQNMNPVYVGILFIVLGILFNQHILELTVVPDRRIESLSLTIVILLFQFGLTVSGLYLWLRKPVIRIPAKSDLILLVLSMSATLFFLELGFRVWLNYLATPNQYRQYALFTDVEPEKYQWTKHHYLNYYPTPNYKNGLTYHNSLGYRAREFSMPKPPGVYRVVALGGSTTYTIAVEDNEKTFSGQLEKILRRKYGYKNVEVINAGVAGYDSWESLINLEFRVLDTDPDLIILYEGTNDVHARLVMPEVYRGDNSGRRRQWDAPAVRFYEQSYLYRIVTRMLGWREQVSLGTFVDSKAYLGFGANIRSNEIEGRELLKKNPPVYFRRNIVNMIAVTRAANIRIMLATWAHSPYFGDYASSVSYQEGFRENNEVVKAVAEAYKVPLFDFAEVMPQSKAYWADGRHVNEMGALAKGELFAKFIHENKLIDKRYEVK